MPTADESSHSTAGIRYIHTAVPHVSYISHCTVQSLNNILPLPVGATHPHRKNFILQLTRLTTLNDIIRPMYVTYSERLLLLVMYDLNWPELIISQRGIDARTTRNPRYSKFSRGLA